jgi:hypothetical protein
LNFKKLLGKVGLDFDNLNLVLSQLFSANWASWQTIVESHFDSLHFMETTLTQRMLAICLDTGFFEANGTILEIQTLKGLNQKTNCVLNVFVSKFPVFVSDFFNSDDQVFQRKNKELVFSWYFCLGFQGN